MGYMGFPMTDDGRNLDEILVSCFELFEMFFEVKEIFIFFPLLQSDSTAIFLGRSGRN